ncbi:toll-like receptor 13 [Engraulis encrasicolus]|uniref:toll-like receptor 13 n=1 Tax=Engraulis encrasicolus TaxID=184585 RepID=UPI002FCFD239
MSCVCELSVRGFLAVVLLISLGLWGESSARIAKHCQNFNEDQLTDMGGTITCRHLPGLGPYAECNTTDLQADLTEVKRDVRTLCIHHSGWTVLSGSFSRFPELRHLHISGTSVRRVEARAFTGLPNLSSLILRFGKCREVPLASEAFEGLESLEELSMWGFKFLGIANDTFSHLVGLVGLNVDGCLADLGDVFCLLPPGMSRLRNLTLQGTNITAVKNQGCFNGSRRWPTDVLSKVNVLSIEGSPIVAIEPNSLEMFQNLSSLSMDFKGKSVSTIWESGIGQVEQLELSGDIVDHLPIDFKRLCQLVHNLTVGSLILNYVQVPDLSVGDVGQCGKTLAKFEIWHSNAQNFMSNVLANLTNLVDVRMEKVGLNDSNFCLDVHKKLSKLLSLIVTNNKLSVILFKQFSCMPNLEILDLSLNSIQTLNSNAFSFITRLRILKLTKNRIKILHSNDFYYLPALEVLNIDQIVNIEYIENRVFRKQRELQELRLGTINIMYTLPINAIFGGIPPKLRYLSIDAGNGTNFVFSELTEAPNGTLILDLKGDLLESNMCDRPNPFYEAVRELKVQSKQFTCKGEFMVSHYPNLESFEFETHIDKTTFDFTSINTLTRLKRLKLTNLYLGGRTDARAIFRNLTNLQVLVLSNCQFRYLTWEMVQDLTALRLLRLYSTTPLTLHDGVFDPLTSLIAVVFDRVDFRCDCDSDWLLNWAERAIHVQVLYLQRQKCVLHYNKLDFLPTMERLCQTDIEYLCYLGTALSILFLSATSLGYKFGRWPFLVVFFRLRGWLERRIGRKRRDRRRRAGDGIQYHLLDEEEEEEEEQFDAFVSFSSRDEAWILRELAPRLEEQGDPRLRLCLHNRDFEVGKGIVDNIAESIYNSRRTVCVLSRHYLRSDWCSLELRVATHRLLEEQKHRLILVFLEHISPFELSAFHRLSKLVKSRTYLDWPEDEAERVNFWERLRRAIAEIE